MSKATRGLGMKHLHIGACCERTPNYNSAGGYKWRYTNANSNDNK